jgi:HPt (histidine-containing phosphotransfer) domain-containing protein
MPAPLPLLAGLDQAEGLRIAQHDVVLYRRLLAMFAGEYQGFGADIAAALAAGDHALALLSAHTLKGASATIGAAQVAAAAGALEAACLAAAPEAELAQRLGAVQALLQPLVAALQSTQPASDTAPTPDLRARAHQRSAAALAMLEQLRGLLQDNDAEAGDLLAALMPRLVDEGDPLADQLSGVARAIDRIDFDVALSALDQALDQAPAA